MPRIAPEQLIKCLAILLTPGGGIKSTDEVARLVLLMQRFSKKLVSKCVYVSILKNTELGLLSDFMQHGGWALVFIWLEKAIDAHNQFFIREILDLLMICPVDVNRLKSNDIPKLVKSLSKNNDLGGGVQELAAKIVSKWLAIVKNVAPTVDPCAKVETSSTKKVDPPPSSPPVVAKSEEEPVPVLKITLKKDGKKLVPSSSSLDDESEGGSSDHSDDSTHKTKITRSKKSSDLHEKSKSSSSHKDTSSRDSERRHRSDSKHKSSSSSSSSDKDRHKSSEHKSSRDKSKLSRGEKERDKSSKSSSSSSSASSKNYLKDKERERERERTKKKEKEKEEKDAKLTKIEKDRQIETDQATLARLMVPSINKLGKIPKKTDKAKINELKENIGKSESSVSSSSGEKKEKPVVAPPAPAPDIPKKNISFSIEKRLPSDQKPKTVKTFNAKFRSTGLEEESAKPPPRAKSSSSSSSASSSSIKSSSTSSSTSGEKKAVKRPSPSKELPPEKKHKPSEHSSSEKSADTLSPTEKAKTSSAPKPKGDDDDVAVHSLWFLSHIAVVVFTWIFLNTRQLLCISNLIYVLLY